MNDDYTTAINDSLSQRIISWTSDVLSSQDKLQAWIDSTQSTNNAHKEAVIDDLLGESKTGKSGQVLTGKSGTVTREWHDKDWYEYTGETHDRSKY